LNRRILTALAAGLGLIVGASPAHALTLTATASNVLASGTYNVTVNPLGGNQYSVTVVGNNDGRTTPVGGPVKHSVGRISIGFLRGDFTYLQPNELLSSGGSTSGGSYLGAPWTVALDADVVRYNAPVEGNDVGAFGENLFSGVITLTTSEAPATITAALQNGTQQWFAQGALIPGQGDLVPEPTSLALALPGLLPLALMLRRRRLE
jgi:hypothetical protein